MPLKNIDKCGINRSFDGIPTFSPRVLHPRDANDYSVGCRPTSSLSSDQINKTFQEKKISETVKEETVKKKGKYKTTSSYGYGQTGVSGMNGVAISSMTPYMRILDGIINQDDWHTKRKIYNDIYTYDLAGAVVDLISTLPYSEFNLTGVSDPTVLQGYVKAIESLNLQELMPSLTTDYLVNGAFVGSLNWDETDNKFTSLMPHSLDDCELTNLNLFGMEPIIDLKFSEEYSNFMSNSDERVERLKNMLPEYLRTGMTSGVVKLNPLTTLYVPRRGLSTSNLGSSYFNRIITIHLIEKALIKGTIETAQRRQRAIMHITAGTDDWEPTSQEMNDLSNYFLAADLDPISGIVVTRSGVNISDVRKGNDSWQWQDIFDFAVDAKMRALGVNEAILSGDASFNTLESALSSFIDNISTTRNTLTKAVFYNKLFPIVAYKNNYRRSSDQNPQNSVLSSIIQKKNTCVAAINNMNISNISEIGNLSDYQIPTVQWVKSLKPRADKEYLELLNTLEEKGIPISMRLFAAAGGENIDDLISSIDDDNELKLEIAEKKKDLIDDAISEDIANFLGIENVEQYLPEPEIPEDQLNLMSKLEAYTKRNKGVINTSKKCRNLASIDEKHGVREYDSEGKRRILTVARKKQLEHKIHKQVAEAMKSLAGKS